jgi:hypothetical protein
VICRPFSTTQRVGTIAEGAFSRVVRKEANSHELLSDPSPECPPAARPETPPVIVIGAADGPDGAGPGGRSGAMPIPIDVLHCHRWAVATGGTEIERLVSGFIGIGSS